jgi:hypothetical protein
MKYTYIYMLIDPITNQVRYIGKANNPTERYKNHKNRCRDKNTHKRKWINKLRLQNLYPEIEVIDTVPINNWHYWEKFWIAYYKFLGCNLINYTSGGDGLTFGNQTSFKKGQIPWNKGLSKPKIKKGFNKKCLDTAFKKGHISWNKGKSGYSTKKKGVSLPIEIKQKISKTMKGKPSLKKRIVKQYSKEMILLNTYSSIIEAIEKTKVKGIANALTGRSKTAGGYIWQ